LIPRGKYGVSVWVTVLLDKYRYGRPSHRLLADFASHGLDIAPGTLTGGLQKLAPLFETLGKALQTKLRSEDHWHADETRWAVFITTEGKTGHRWYLWVFQSPSAVHFVLDPTRAAKVVKAELGDVGVLVISCDRYSAYKKIARLYPGIQLAFCWAHQRRDFLELGNEHPQLLGWAMTWVDETGELYRLNDARLAVDADSDERPLRQMALENAVQKMSDRIDDGLKEGTLKDAAVKVLQSMRKHWNGLTLFVSRPWVPMDNNQGERTLRNSAVGRKNFYGSGSLWSGHLTATMYSLFATLALWQINERTWLTLWLQACADCGSQAPKDIEPFLPWTMNTERLAKMRAPPTIDSS
jgi:transposase